MNIQTAAAKVGHAIRSAVEHHGAPNRFWPRELHLEHGGPPAMLAGQAWTKARADVEAAVGAGLRVSYTPGAGFSVEPSETLFSMLGASAAPTA